MNFGCNYVSRLDVCQKSPDPGILDPRCKISGNRCIPSGVSVSQPPQVPVPSKRDEDIEEIYDISTIEDHQPNAKISGPIAGYSLIYKGKKYYFFSDAHHSTSGTCPAPCDPEANCFDITTLLIDIFQRAAKKNQWVDFYLEVPYIARTRYHPTREQLAKFSQDIIYKIYVEFWDCFIKQGCIYNTTRFHYVDIRQTFRTTDQKISGDITIYEHYIESRVQDSIRKLLEMYITQSPQQDDFIENTDLLITDLYKSGGQTMTSAVEPKNKRMFRMYLESDNYYNDVGDLFENALVNIKGGEPARIEIRRYMLPGELIVERDGKFMHKIRAQLYELSKESPDQALLAEKIKNFCLSQYNKINSNVQLVIIWNGVMKIYRQMIGKQSEKFRTLGGLKVSIDDLSDQVKKHSLLSTMIVSSNSLIMDAYTLARMFREFPRSSHHVNSTRAIIYAGHKHIKNYIAFFYKTFGSEIIEYNPNKRLLENFNLKNYNQLSRCISINIDDFN